MVFSFVKILSALLAFYARIWMRPHWRVCRVAGAAARGTASLWREGSRAGGRTPPPGGRQPGRGRPRSWGGRGWGAWWGSRGRSTAGSSSPGACCCCCCCCSPSRACGGQPGNNVQVNKYLNISTKSKVRRDKVCSENGKCSHPISVISYSTVPFLRILGFNLKKENSKKFFCAKRRKNKTFLFSQDLSIAIVGRIKISNKQF